MKSKASWCEYSDIVPTEHQTTAGLTRGKDPHSGTPKIHDNAFHDEIGPGGNRWSPDVTSTRVFTATLGGKPLGIVPIVDKNGEHIQDEITINNTDDYAVLNGSREPTNVPDK